MIGMEACGSAHYWGRKLQAMGHVVKLMAPQFVRPYVKTNKNDAADAEAICEAVTRPSMRFVPIKTDEQQAILSVQRVRQSFVKARTAQANQIRGLLAEFGVVIPQAIAHIARRVPQLMDQQELPDSFRTDRYKCGHRIRPRQAPCPIPGLAHRPALRLRVATLGQAAGLPLCHALAPHLLPLGIRHGFLLHDWEVTVPGRIRNSKVGRLGAY